MADLLSTLQADISNGTLTLTAGSNNLNSPDVDALLNAYFGGTLVAQVTQTAASDTQVGYDAQISSTGFVLCPVGAALTGTLVFVVDTSQVIQLTATVQAPDPYCLPTSYPDLSTGNWSVNTLNMSGAVFTLASTAADQPGGFTASVTPDGLLSRLSWMIGAAFPVSGTLGYAAGTPAVPAAAFKGQAASWTQGDFALSIGLGAGVGTASNGSGDTVTTGGAWLETAFTAEPLTIPVLIPLQAGGNGMLSVRLDTSNGPIPLVDGLDALAGFLDVDALTSMLTGVPIGQNLYLAQAAIVLDPVQKSFVHFQFTVALDTSWNIMDGLFLLDDLFTQITLPAPSGSTDTFTVTLGAEMTVGGGTLVFGIILPDMVAFAHLLQGQAINIDSFLDDLADGLQLPGTNDPDDPLSIVTLDLRLDIKESNYSLQAGASGQWSLIPGLTLQDLNLSLAYSNSALQNFQFSATFGIGSFLDLFVSMTYTPTSWRLEGGTAPGTSVDIGDLITALAAQFGATISLPPVLAGLQITNVKLSYTCTTSQQGAASSSVVAFGLETKFPLAGFEVDITVSLTLKSVVGGGYTAAFAGLMDVSGYEFLLAFDAQTFQAIFETPDNDPLTLQDLANWLGLAAIDIPSALNLSLNSAFLAYQGGDPSFTMGAVSDTYGEAFFGTAQDEQTLQTGYIFGVQFPDVISTSVLPLVGDDLGDLLALDNLTMVASSVAVKNFVVPRVTGSGIHTTITFGTDPNSKIDIVPGFQLFGLIAFADAAYTTNFNLLLYNPAKPATTSAKMLVAAETTGSSSFAAPLPPVPPPANVQTAPSHGPGIWVKVQKQLGPVYLIQVGLNAQDDTIWFYLDGSLSAAGLTLELIGLGLGFNLADPWPPQGALSGIGVDFDFGPVEIGGGLNSVQNPPADVLFEYDGTATIKVGPFSITAEGSYAQIQDGNDTAQSMFLFGFLGVPLGGIGCFFITGVAAGFGYNSNLIMPTVDQVPQFPLVAAAATSDGGPFKNTTNALQALAVMDEWIVPTVGQDWGSAGIRFTSYEMLKSLALVSIGFGSTFQASFIGTSTLTVPTEETYPLAYAQLNLVTLFDPSSGLFYIDGALNSKSYILDPSFKISGGFAFYIWFGANPNATDFVVTFGGYSPTFNAPSYYPSVPRIGVNARFGNYLSLKGNCYFALTPSALMAGGALDFSLNIGPLQCWFDANADFMLGWKPFSYYASVYVDVGVSLRMDLLFTTTTLTVHVGTNLDLYGPEFGLRIYIDVWFISFSIAFGSANQSNQPISWSDFTTAFLPADTSDYVGAQPADGLVKNLTQTVGTAAAGASPKAATTTAAATAAAPPDWIMSPARFSVSLNLNVPGKTASFNNTAQTGDWSTAFGVAPVDVASDAFLSDVAVTFVDAAGNTPPGMTLTPILQGQPKAMWGNFQPDYGNSEQTIASVLSGFTLSASVPTPDVTVTLPVASLLYSADGQNTLTWQTPDYPTTDTFNQADAQSTIDTSFTSSAVEATRDALIADIAAFGMAVDQSTDIVPLGEGNDGFVETPTLSLLGEIRS